MIIRKNRRWLAFMLSALMTVTMMPSAVFANEQAEVVQAAESERVSDQTPPEEEPITSAASEISEEISGNDTGDTADSQQIPMEQGSDEQQAPAEEGTDDLQQSPADLESNIQPASAEDGINSQADVTEEPQDYLTSLQFAKDENGENLIPITPAFDKDVTEYTFEVDDYYYSYSMYQKYTIEDPSITVRVRYPQSGTSQFWTLQADKFVWLPMGANIPYYEYQLIKDNVTINKFQVLQGLKATLKGLDAGETMRPSAFDRDQKEYTVSVEAEAATFTFTPTGYDYGSKRYTITAAGVTGQSGQPMTIPITWDGNGQMRVPLLVSGEGVSESEYVLNLRRVDVGDVPFLMAEPEGGQIYADGVEKGDVTPLKVLAKANGSMTYQWYDNDTDSTEGGKKIDGATESVYYPQFEAHDRTKDHYFYCEITNTNSTGTYTAQTTPVRVTVIPDPTPYDIQLVYEDGSVVPKEGVTVNQGETAPTFKALFKTRAEGGTDDKTISYQYYLLTKDGSENIDSGRTETYSLLNDRNAQGYLYCMVSVTVNGVKYTGSSRTDDFPGILCTVCGTSVKPPSIGASVNGAKEVQYLLGREKLDDFSASTTTLDKGSGVTTTWQWLVSEDEGEDKTFRPADGEGASGVSQQTNPNQSFSFQYTPESSNAEKPFNRYYKCRATNTLKSYNGQTYTAEKDSPVITVSFVTLESILGEGQSAWNGSGTTAAPYQVVSANDLELLQQVVNEKGFSMDGMVFSMTQDITLPEDWTPIGSLKPGTSSTSNGKNVNPFSGIFDGGGHTLTVPEDGLPLLGYVRGATVRNMNLYGTKIPSYGLVQEYYIDYGPTGNYGDYSANGQPLFLEVDNVTIKKGTRILKSGFTAGGGSAANIVNIKNCTAEAGVVIGYSKTQSRIGSFIEGLSGTMQNCSSAATVYGDFFVGGLASSKREAMGPCRILNCSFTGSIEATGQRVGGIIGMGYNASSAPNTPCVTVKNCYVAADITGKNYVGGILGDEWDSLQCWENGAGYIQNNYFYGTLTATDEDPVVGGIIGRRGSLDRYNVITNNYFVDTCGAAKAIGQVGKVDTTVSIDRGDAEYVTTEKYARSDDPLGADAAKLGQAVPAASFKDGTITAALNAGEGSFENWKQGTDYPVLGEGAVWADTLNLSGYKTNYNTLEEFTSEGIQATVTMSDGTVQKVPAEEISFFGYVQEPGSWTVTGSYKGCNASFTVKVTQATNQDYAAQVSKLIAAIGDVTLESQEAIEAARAAYDALSDSQKALVTNLDSLTAAEQKLAELEQTEGLRATAAQVTESIRALGTITLDSKAAIEAARAAYDALSEEAKTYVENYADLVSAEEELRRLQNASSGTTTPSGTPSETGTPSAIQTPQATPSITPEPSEAPTQTPTPEPSGTPATPTPGATDEPPKTTVIENPDGTKTEITESTITNEDGSIVQITETKEKDVSGELTGSSIKAEISTDSQGSGASAVVTVIKDASGTVTNANAAVSNPTASSIQKALISGSMVRRITQIAGTDKVKVNIQNGSGAKANTIVANTADITAGNKLYIVAKAKNGTWVLVNAKTYTVTRSGDLFATVKGTGTYKFITDSRMNAFSKRILRTVKAKNTAKTIKKSKTAKMTLKNTLNMENVKSIQYSVSKKSVASVTKKGVIKAKKAGTAIVKAKVTLKNGRTKTVKTKITVKK